MKHWIRQRPLALAALLASASAILLALGVCLGSSGLQSLQSLAGDALSQQIVWDIRLPRTAGAWASGALLGLAGAVTRNAGK